MTTMNNLRPITGILTKRLPVYGFRVIASWFSPDGRDKRSKRKASADMLKTFFTALTIGGCMLMPVMQTDAAAADFPSRTVKIIVGFPAGTAPDALARLVGDRLEDRLGHPVVVENVAGAAGNTAARRVAQAEPDGHTLLLAGNATLTVNQFIYRDLGFDPSADFLLISQVAMTPNVLVVHPDIPAKTPLELAEYARSRSGDLTYAHVGLGTSTHLAAELFARKAGASMIAVPYTGGNAIYPDLLAGRVDVCFCNLVTSLPLIRDGKLRALALTSLKGVPAAADISTMDGSGFAGFEATAWFGLVAPAGTPAKVVERFHSEAKAVLAEEAMQARLVELAMQPIGNSPEEFATAVSAETTYWKAVIDAVGLKPQ